MIGDHSSIRKEYTLFSAKLLIEGLRLATKGENFADYGQNEGKYYRLATKKLTGLPTTDEG